MALRFIVAVSDRTDFKGERGAAEARQSRPSARTARRSRPCSTASSRPTLFKKSLNQKRREPLCFLLAFLLLKKNIVFACGFAENAIGASSYKPGDIIKSMNGLHVEIGNTDAEGRLVLADTMTYVQ